MRSDGTASTETIPDVGSSLSASEELETDEPWLVVVWNDPINLMSYVTFVLQKLFGFSKEKATKLMLEVHNRGRAVVAHGPAEQAEHDVARLHGHGLLATMERAG
jgi:ATP-dependent Clp protease adaptor protein ClpS